MCKASLSNSYNTAANAATLPDALIRLSIWSDLTDQQRWIRTQPHVAWPHWQRPLSCTIWSQRCITYSIISHDCAFYLPAAKLGTSQQKLKANRMKVSRTFCMFHELCTHCTYWNYSVEIQTHVEIPLENLSDTGTAAVCRWEPERLSEPVSGCTGPLTLAVPIVRV